MFTKPRLHLEPLPDDFIVYKTQEDLGYYIGRSGGIPASKAITSCCDVRPVRYYPDWPDTKLWWLLCPSCHYAIKANGDAA